MKRRFYLHDCDSVVVKDSGHIFRRELVGSVADQKAGLAHSTIANNDASEQMGL